MAHYVKNWQQQQTVSYFLHVQKRESSRGIYHIPEPEYVAIHHPCRNIDVKPVSNSPEEDSLKIPKCLPSHAQEDVSTQKSKA
ncbi:hypothetical protein ACLOJK_008288 [Asimina triloba]